MPQRFYLMKAGGRPAYMGDVGSFVRISGVIFEGPDASYEGTPAGGVAEPANQVILLLPDSSIDSDHEATQKHQDGFAERHGIDTYRPTVVEWSEIIQHSDDPSIFELDENGHVKIIHRKVRFQISGAVQQRVWALDGCKCVFCLRKIGQVQLTIDHFHPLETGGKNDQSNYLTACRKCNKRKGNMDPRAWCAKETVMFDYDWYVKYLAARPLEFKDT